MKFDVFSNIFKSLSVVSSLALMSACSGGAGEVNPQFDGGPITVTVEMTPSSSSSSSSSTSSSSSSASSSSSSSSSSSTSSSSSSSSSSSTSSSSSSSSSSGGQSYDLPLAWHTQFKNLNGSTISKDEISGYALEYRQPNDPSFTQVLLNNGSANSYTLQDLESSEWIIQVAALNGSGQIGSFTTPVSVDLNSQNSSVQAQAAAQYQGPIYSVSNVNELVEAIGDINDDGGPGQIVLAPGTYTLDRTQYIYADNMTLRAASGTSREQVIIEGESMSANGDVGNLFRVMGSYFAIDGITLQKSRNHLVQIAGESDADYPIFRNCIFRDGYEQLLKVSRGSDPAIHSDGGLVENCLFEYTAGVGPNYYIGGVDGHGVDSWVIRNNTFKNIASPGGRIAEHAIHLWNGSANNLVENNVIIDCDRGVGFGMLATGKMPNEGGIIRNNFIYHSGNPEHEFADVGIVLEESRDVQVYNNTVILNSTFPWTIEYRWSYSEGNQIFNNLTNGDIRQRNEASANVYNNITDIDASLFVDADSGDLHLSKLVIGVVNEGTDVDGLKDIDGDIRENNDIGADEYRF